ncbi:hypothetical protein [Natrinema versiforme]|uniref:Uncharacterized protein n=1 Tax=Natrinema versiforme TaxID=88724 RepID=A0A4P8WL43_9EURY|nr:hypothetical protein [Natrinema versiforme]QCS44084.1 hypothetical protein FEJ81_17690 [Natrinema versiforme]
MSQSTDRVQRYMTNSEEISYQLSFRPRGLLNWIKSLFGFGVTTWYLTDERLIQQTEVGGGFNFQYIPLEKISSVEYGTKLNFPALILGSIAALIGLSGVLSDASDAGVLFLLIGAASIGYAYYRRRQVLAVSASGSASFSLTISSGDQVDEFLWYIHAEQQKQSEPVLRH